MAVPEVRPEELGPGLSGEPRGDHDGGNEQHGEDDADELVHDATKDTTATSPYSSAPSSRRMRLRIASEDA